MKAYIERVEAGNEIIVKSLIRLMSKMKQLFIPFPSHSFILFVFVKKTNLFSLSTVQHHARYGDSLNFGLYAVWNSVKSFACREMIDLFI